MGPSDVMMLTLSDGRLQPLLHAAYVERNAAVSPDGRFVAYETNADGLFQIKVRPFPDVDSGQWSVSSQEGFQPAWAPDGSALFFRAADGAMMRVPVRPGPTWTEKTSARRTASSANLHSTSGLAGPARSSSPRPPHDRKVRCRRVPTQAGIPLVETRATGRRQHREMDAP